MKKLDGLAAPLLLPAAGFGAKIDSDAGPAVPVLFCLLSPPFEEPKEPVLQIDVALEPPLVGTVLGVV